MKIVEFQLENIGVHKSQKLDLTKVPHDLVMINGYNNYGKTTLLDGLRFCLFDQHIDPEFLSNSSEKSDLKAGGTLPMMVRVKLELEDKSLAIVERRQFYTKQDDGTFVPSSPDSVVSVNLIPPGSKSGDVEYKTDKDAERWLATQFPPKFMNFILFNGEEMEKFLNPKLRKTVEEVVVQSARLEHFNDVRNLIIGYRDDLQKQAKKVLGKGSSSDSQDDIQGLQSDLDELERLQRIDNEKLEELETKSDDLERSLNSSEDGKKLVRDHSELVENIRLARKRVQELAADLREQTWVAGVNSFFELRLTESLNKQVGNAKDNGMYPARFAKEALESIIRDGQCICGKHVHGDKDAIGHLQDQISLHDKAGPIGQGLQAVEASLLRVTGKAGEARRTHRTMTVNLNRKSEELDGLENKLEIMLRENPELEGEASSKASPAEDFKLVRGEIQTLSSSVEVRKGEIEVLKQRLVDARAAQSAALEREGTSKSLVSSLNFIDRVIEQSKDFSELVLTGVRDEITLYINEKFSTTVGGNYKTIVNPDFSVVCLHDDGSVARISKGQEMLRAYFFAFALRKVAGMEFPLIVDSPKGRLDGRNSMTVIDSIAELIRSESESQMVFFMIDDECTPDVRSSFLELGATEYHLSFEEQPFRRSTIEVGMDPEWVRHGVWKMWAENEALKAQVGNA